MGGTWGRDGDQRRGRGAALMVALALALATGCSGGGTAEEVRLQDLVRFADRYDGELVSSAGVVHRIEEPEHYWIEDGDRNRVRIEPHAAVSGHVGDRVRVVGRFHYAQQSGRRLEASEVRVLE
jgi:hypothetical protein